MGNTSAKTGQKTVQLTRGDRNIAWIERYCYIPEGKFVGQRVSLRPWQKKIIKGIYDSPTRTAIISFGRKNAKTTLSSWLLLLHLCGPEARPNSQLYSAAQSRDQAALLFSLAAKTVKFSPELRQYVKITPTKKMLSCAELGSEYVALSSDAATAFGKSPCFIVHDELGQVRGPTSDLYDSLETACGAQDNPLSIVISTQAPTDLDLLSILIDDALTNSDPEIKLFLYAAPEELDPFLPETIRLANPAFGDFLSEKETLATAAKARRIPSKLASFRNLILNQRVEQSSPFLTRDVWNSCGNPINEDIFVNSDVYLGIDLSGRNDMTAIAIAAMDALGQWHLKVHFFAPSEGLEEREINDKVPYRLWVEQGYLTLTPGATVDYDFIAEQLEFIQSAYRIKAVKFDRWRMDVLKSALARAGITLPLEPFGQGFKDMSPALDEVESLFLNGKINHGNNPILKWNAANATVLKDPAGNRKLDKSKQRGRIDGLVSSTMAIGGAVVQDAKKQVYNYRGLTVV